MKVIIDQIGRTVVGVEAEGSTDNVLALTDPVILHVQPDPQSGKLQVQTIPLIFVEFIDKGSRDSNIWRFNRSQITESDIVLDEKIAEAARNINKVSKEQASKTEEDPTDNVVKLFDE